MATAKKFNMDGAEVGSVELSEAVFNVPDNGVLVHQVVKALQNAKRQGTAKTKERSEVSGGGKKPYRQKGTGNARHGSIREPQMKGGGTVFGPRPRSYRQDIPIKVRRKALSIVLSERVRRDALCVLDKLECSKPKTKPFAAMVQKLSTEGKKTLFVTGDASDNVLLSARNIPKLTLRRAGDVNALDVLNAARVVLVQDAVEILEKRLS
jgi:large subunit ribosomal protein L4